MFSTWIAEAAESRKSSDRQRDIELTAGQRNHTQLDHVASKDTRTAHGLFTGYCHHRDGPLGFALVVTSLRQHHQHCRAPCLAQGPGSRQLCKGWCRKEIGCQEEWRYVTILQAHFERAIHMHTTFFLGPLQPAHADPDIHILARKEAAQRLT